MVSNRTMFPKPAGTSITTQHSLQKFICCWLGSYIGALERSFCFSTQQCNTNPTASAPTEKLETADDVSVATFVPKPAAGGVALALGLGPKCLPRERKTSKEDVEAACHKLGRELCLQKAVCVPTGLYPCLEEKEKCAAPSLGALLTLQLHLFCKAGAPCNGNNPYRAVCVDKLYVSLRLALLFVFEGKAHYCCYVVWVWPKLFKWSYFPFYPSSTDVFPCFPWEDTDFPFSSSSVFPFLSCSTEDLYMSQDMIPLRIYLI